MKINAMIGRLRRLKEKHGNKEIKICYQHKEIDISNIYFCKPMPESYLNDISDIKKERFLIW